MSLELLCVIEGRSVYFDKEKNIVQYCSKGAVDSDGPGGSLQEDPDWQPTTSLRWLNPETNHIEYLNLHEVPVIVVPPQICQLTPKGVVVLGSLAMVRFNDLPWAPGVVGEVGPHDKLGEYSMAMHKALGLNSNPRRGGTLDYNAIQCQIHCGAPASLNINGIIRRYHLQPYGR